jgi:hypothetical protein
LFVVMLVGSIIGKAAWSGGVSLSSQMLALPFALFATVGAVVASRRPENRLGWLYLGIGLLAAFTSIGEAIQDVRFPADGVGRPLLMFLYGLTNSAWYPTLGLTATLAILWFPDGRPPTRRWRWVEVGVVVEMATVVSLSVVALGFGLFPGPREGSPDNPLGIEGGEVVLNVLQAVGGFAFLVFIGASVTGFIVRFRRSRGVERQQLKWFRAGAMVLGVGICLDMVLDLNTDVLFTVAASAVPLAAGVAITRYRLYDLDRLISRAVAYLAVSALLVAVYAGIVVGIGALTGRTDSPVLIAGATLAVAALVRPLLRRVKAGIDRRFYRRRYDAERTLAAFSARLRDEVDIAELRAGLLAVVGDAVQPAAAALWLRTEAKP